MEKQRDITFDVMKGIAILAMVAGHCFIPFKLHHFIYIWHMPLFFFASGFFFKDKPLAKVFLGIWRGLLVPYVVTATIILLCILFADGLCGTNLLKTKGVALLGINGLFANPDAYGGLYKCGPIWFLLALAWCKIVYCVLGKLGMNMIVETLLLAALSYLIVSFSKTLYLPFFILQGFVSLIFYHLGYLFKQNLAIVIRYKKLAIGLGVLALFVGMLQSGMDIWALWFSNWTLNVYAAIGSVILLYFGTKSILSTPPIMSCGIISKLLMYLAYVGRLSILVLALHAVEKTLDLCTNLFEIQHIIPVGTMVCRFLTILSQFLFCLLGVFVVERINLVRKLFYIR